MAKKSKGSDWEPFSAFLSSNPYIPSESMGASLELAERTREKRVEERVEELPVDPVTTLPSLPKSTKDDATQAVGNALTLGFSLGFTLVIGFVVSLLVPRWLDVERWGQVRGAEATMALVLSVLAFGFDTYIRKEVAVRPDHAREFVPSVVLFRTLTSGLMVIGASGFLFLRHRNRLEFALLVLFGVSRYLIQTGEIFAAMLHAVGEVSGIRRITGPAKVLWALIILGGLVAGFGPIVVPLGWVIAEGLKTVGLGVVAARALRLRVMPTRGAFTPVLRASIPYSAGIWVASGAMFLDITLMKFLVGDTETGYYGASQSMGTLAFFIGPIIPWVLMPLASRAAASSTRELYGLARRAFEFAIVLGIPSAVLLGLNADVIIGLQGNKYLPAVPGLRFLAVTIALTYFITMTSVFLQALDRAWLGVRVAVVGLAISFVLNLLLQKKGVAWFGPGGAGTVAAAVATLNELIVALSMLWFLGRRAWDDRTFRTLGATLAAAVPVVLVDRILANWGFSWGRVVADVVFYGANLMLLNVVDVAALRPMVASFRSKESLS